MPVLHSERRGSERPPFPFDARRKAPMPSQQEGPSSSGLPPPAGGPTKPSKSKNPACPKCQRRMTVKQVMPVLFASGIDDVIFGCVDCGTEQKRTVRRD